MALSTRRALLAPLVAVALLLASEAARAEERPAEPPAIEAPTPAPTPALGACPRKGAVLRVQISDPDPVLSTEDRIETLHGLTGRPRSQNARHLALTTSRIEWRSEVAARAAGGPSAYCVVPASVTLTLAQAEHRIRIAQEVPEGGCLFAEVEAHERRHVTVNRDTLRVAARQSRAAADAWARTAEGRGATLEEAVGALRNGLRRAIEPAMARMRAAQASGHAAIDTPAEYRRLARVCPEDQAVLAERLHGG